ncbi:MAG: Ppx/GppA family phosphatase [Actinobacteria bacterium]|nr:Ppx/GppA family phosphatase [Actinomycetota bacterium]
MTDTIAAIDIGTNSFHLVVARPGDGHTFEVVAREKEMVRLGAGAGGRATDLKDLQPDAIDRGIATLGRFRQIAEIHDAKVYAVATSAVREAENANVFVKRARKEAGVDVDVITGVEEARLIHLGVLQAVPVFDKRLVLVDIGGGSTEILVGEKGEVLASGSLKVGALRLQRRFFRTDLVHPAAVDSCRRYVRAALAPMARPVRKKGFDVAVGSSGTIQAVAGLVNAARGDDSPRSFNLFELTRDEVDRAVQAIVGAETVALRRELVGIDPSRADIILPGALILQETMHELGMAQMTVSDYALREGVMLDALERERGSALHHLHDLRRRSVIHLGELMDDDPVHSAQSARLALKLFDEIHDLGLHQLDDQHRELLEAAALLANVGLFVSHDKHHKHSYYVIRNSDHLAGFTDHEIEVIALVARYHRKGEPKPTHPEFDALGNEQQKVVRMLAGILRVAIALDRSHAGLVKKLKCKLTDGGKRGLVIDLTPVDTDADLSLERYTADDRKGLLEEVLGLEVVIDERQW